MTFPRLLEVAPNRTVDMVCGCDPSTLDADMSSQASLGDVASSRLA